ncbi:uncharacterized protein LOC130903982 [Diorhabda carinulata]|uniref:uncharacterized protein LOC130903982 n=1 Tax=Diorhabda carinulata TaxID=1163345 RepID=UPI0025A0A94A|nr:uncharacterized protein LOC130903982 [Diorhabda carinulata]
MSRLVSLFVCIFAGILLVDSQFNVEIQEPKLTSFLNRITNTTFDLIRSGINVFGNTIETIITTFSKIEDRLSALVELIRSQLIKGVPELSIPILDPLHVNKIEFDVRHEAALLKGNAKNITIKHISKFVVTKEKLTDLGKLRFRLDINLTFPFIRANGTYQVNGLIGQTFRIFGNGPFKLNIIDLRIATSTILKFTLPGQLQVENISILPRLRKLENNFENMMNDPDTGALINKAISRLAPEALKIFWPELKRPIELEFIKYINNLLDNASVVNIAKRIFNIT